MSRASHDMKWTPIVAIGGSAGGLDAFLRLLTHLPADTGFAFVFLQHLDSQRDSLLPELFRNASCLPVHEAADDMEVVPNEVYVVPPARGVTFAAGVLRLAPRAVPDVPSDLIDGFMESLASSHASAAVGVVLSGNGRDGVEGLAAIRAAGGVTFCQTPGSARNDAMPRAALAADMVDFVLEPEQIAAALAGMRRPRADDTRPAEGGAAREAADLELLSGLLRTPAWASFADYTPAPMLRRIGRRMRVTREQQLSAYLARVRSEPEEADALRASLLVGVTSFFRDPEAFDELSSRVLAPLVAACKRGDVLRIWTPGCATGEEPYSIAMCVLELLGDHVPGKSVQIFATDVSAPAIASARAGLYAETIQRDVSPERLRRFFDKRADGYRIMQRVRDLCLFARHDVLRNPTFSNMHLVSCRNLLLYFAADAQKRILGKFHRALAPSGRLFLGASESISAQSLLFEELAGSGCIYGARDAASAAALAKLEASHSAARAASQPTLSAGLCEAARTPVAGGYESRGVSDQSAGPQLVEQLREELMVTREHLQSSVAEQEKLNRSLRATLEALQSANEELQATNEELATGKEELQSANEELSRAHDEVNLRNAELTQVVHDHVSLVAAASVAAVLFGRDLQLRQFTPIAAKLMRLTSLDIGKPLSGLETGLAGCDLCAIVAESIEHLCPGAGEVSDGCGRRYALAVRPYLSLDGSADGAVMTIAEITALRAAQEALEVAELRITALELARRSFSN